MTTTCTRFSPEPFETGIHYHNELLNSVLLKLSNKPSTLLEVGHRVLHCILQCREQRPYLEELNDDFNLHLHLHYCSIKMLYQAATLVSAALYHHSCPEVFILLKLWALSQRRRWHLTVVCLPLTFTHLYSFTHSLIYHLIYIIRYVYYWLQFRVD